MMINAGDLRHIVTLQTDSSTTSDNIGKHTQSYITVGDFYALVELQSGTEVYNAMQRKGIFTYAVTMRANIGTIKPTDILLWVDSDGLTQTLNIKTAKKDPFGVGFSIEADEYILNQ